jgi:hypothetical protein
MARPGRRFACARHRRFPQSFPPRGGFEDVGDPLLVLGRVEQVRVNRAVRIARPDA